jgi:flagella basal body P-ring formation protein FlgA
MVDMRVEREGLMIRALGEVQRDGIAGEIVPAENSSTGARVLGMVQPDGSLLVVRPGGDRRL